ncbi:PIN domain-containing protein [Candidatus Woesearchaeota archaeon]|nr:PIN domain-containing protein [Candidatus Woesearchaeota archaeon]
MIDTSIAVEKEVGATTIFTVVEYPKCLDYVTEVVYPDDKDFERAIELSRRLTQIGKQIGAIDILIASICINRYLKLITKDNHFGHIKEVDKSFQLKIVK